MNNLFIEIVSILLLALLSGVGYYIKNVSDNTKQIGRKVDKIDERLQSAALDIADMKPKVDALWHNFLKHKDL